VNDLRNKKVLDFETDDIDSLAIAADKSEMQIQKTGTDWFIKKPMDAKADATEISTFLSSIKFARASGFAEANVDNKAAGLEPPAVRITLHDKKANASRELLIGKSPETDKYYARDNSRPAIFI